jgi:hypothetical protein
MDRSRALNELSEAADLMRMVEELMSGNPEKVAQCINGIRVTVRNAREAIVESHDALARELVAALRARSNTQEGAPIARSEIARSEMNRSEMNRSESTSAPRSPLFTEESSASASNAGANGNAKRDLRSAIDKFVER